MTFPVDYDSDSDSDDETYFHDAPEGDPTTPRVSEGVNIFRGDRRWFFDSCPAPKPTDTYLELC